MMVKVPERIARLPRDTAGRPIPWFTGYVDGKPDLRVSDPKKTERAITEGRCWVCGQRLERSGSPLRCFIVGPISAYTCVAAEPPSHRTCALYSVRTCPFLSMPGRQRREARLPDDTGLPAGAMLKNPGVVLIWMCRRYDVEWHDGSSLFRMSFPSGGVYAYREGLPALRTDLDAELDRAAEDLRATAAKSGGDANDVERMISAGRIIIETRMRG